MRSSRLVAARYRAPSEAFPQPVSMALRAARNWQVIQQSVSIQQPLSIQKPLSVQQPQRIQQPVRILALPYPSLFSFTSSVKLLGIESCVIA
jgi:hypothetical protein